jgi:hypothetical protein
MIEKALESMGFETEENKKKGSQHIHFIDLE